MAPRMLPIHIPPTVSPKPSSWSAFGRPQARWLFLICVLTSLALYWLWSPYYGPLEPGSINIPLPWKSEPVVSLEVPLPSPVPEYPPPPPPKPQVSWEKRKEEVRDAFVHALSGYMQHAFPYDELLPLNGGKTNNFNGWSVTLIDALDTMWMMGLKEEFYDAVGVVAAQNFTVNTGGSPYAPFFETTIRYLGGLLSAYALSKEPVLLSRADDLGRALLPAFNATPSGLPGYAVNTQNGEITYGWMGDSVLLAEAASCQLEYKYLAKLTGRAEYYEKAETVMEVLYNADPPDGLFAVTWSPGGQPYSAHMSVGASADSGYEYLLKQWLLNGDTKAHDQYLKSIDGILKNLFFVSPTRGLLYVTDTHMGYPTHNLEHLSCFLAGLLALGTHTLHLPAHVAERHQWAAEGLAYTCYISYVDQGSGVGPDGLLMEEGKKWVDELELWEMTGREGGVPPGLKEGGPKAKGERDYTNSSQNYLLRPETVESLFILWKTTGDAKWRERGYEIFKAIMRVSKTHFGFASISAVDRIIPPKSNEMPSYFLAETLKYLYLLFEEGNSYPLEKWVFNTEAHPLPIFTWNKWEKELYNITY
ncbi:glycoside hydrolase family 47 protein [Collybia nuda]|uniref:alpha-1,2-Mannosidase n=1 Tax=Collybia nuda TaxID=64659 RepID=A0A9P5Y8J3_9AGAR|nr:glycoside hydrolase family 47 protein [Collybia nuda]